MSAKRLYLNLIQVSRTLAAKTGFLKFLDEHVAKHRIACWLRSLFSLYDFDDLVTLDIPWWTFKSSDLVEQFLQETLDAKVFEWGSGASTLWLAKRTKSVVSIEHDEHWASKVRHASPGNVHINYIPSTLKESGIDSIASSKSGFANQNFKDYVEGITLHPDKFDLIVIDGRARESCISIALEFLKPTGLIVFDNVDRKRYREAIYTIDLPIEVRWTRGLTPCLPYPTRTALIRFQ